MVPQSSSRRQGWGSTSSLQSSELRSRPFNFHERCVMGVSLRMRSTVQADDLLHCMSVRSFDLIVCLLKQLGASISKCFEFLLNVHCVHVPYTDMKVWGTEASQRTTDKMQSTTKYSTTLCNIHCNIHSI